MERVWGKRPDESELVWFYEQNPVRPASVLLAELDGQVVATVAIAFVRMEVGGEELDVGMPLRVATDPAYRGQGIFARLQAENEERVRALGIRLLLTVPNEASSPIFLTRLGWQTLPALRVWVGPWRPRLDTGRSRRVERFSELPPAPVSGDRVLRDAAWLNWRFAAAPRPYTLLEGGGYAVLGRRGHFGVLACVSGGLLAAASAAAGTPLVLAAPPPSERGRYLRAGYIPSPRQLTVLGKALDPGQSVPAHPHFELGDLDFL
jgi:GNAT superfamily N-acetyltransferase